MVRRLIVPLALFLAVSPASAQNRDFLFGTPRVTLGLRLGLAAPRAQSEIFDLATQELFLERDDFRTLDVTFDLGVRVHDRVDVAVTVGHSESETLSEYRDYVGTDDRPIEQTTRLARTPITVGAKAYLRDRGRPVSRFAWIPNGWAPYVTLGGGLMIHDFSQEGEFVDFQSADGELRDIFYADYQSRGVAPMARAGAGIEIALGRQLLATGEASYLWARDEMSREFEDFDRIDLSGAQLALGLAVRF